MKTALEAPQPEHSQLDQKVRDLLAEGDVVGAATLTVRTLGPEVLGFLCRMTGSDADADDVFAATCARLWRSLPGFRWRCSLRTWTYVIAQREANRHRRTALLRAKGRVGVSALEGVVFEVTTRSRLAARTERDRLVDKLRAELPPDDRAILILRVDRALAWEEIALAFLPDPDGCTDAERKREAARVRKRFQLIKDRLAARAREEGLV